jgi:hypothetical protein
MLVDLLFINRAVVKDQETTRKVVVVFVPSTSNISP